MTQILRQSTQVVVVIGPFVDVGDGFTPETGITLSGADEAELLKADTTTTTSISGNTIAAITGCDGWYGVTLTTTDTNTCGALTIMVNDDSVCLPVFARFQVVEEAIFDALYAASANAFSGAAGSTTLTALASGSITAAVVATGAIDADAIADNAIDAGAIAADAITAAKIAAGAIDAATFAADVDAEILSYIVDDATRIDASALNTASVTTVPAIVADTNELQTDWANGGRLDLILDARASQTSVDDLPTNAELATALGTADDAVLAAIAALNNLSAAQVNAEVVDALATDTYAEPGQGSPGATITLAAKIGYLYKAWRNRTTQTASEYALYADDATTKDQEAAVSDDGVTLDRGEVATGA